MATFVSIHSFRGGTGKIEIDAARQSTKVAEITGRDRRSRAADLRGMVGHEDEVHDG